MRRPWPILLLAGLALLASPARAAELEPSVRGLIERAERAITDERWCDAARLLIQARERGGESKLVFNAAIAADRAGDRVLALSLFERFAALSPLSKLRESADHDAERLRLLIERSGPGAACPEEPSAETAAATTPTPTATAPPAAVGATGSPGPAAAPDGCSAMRTVGWTFVGAGAASAAVGGGFGWSAAAQIAELESMAGGEEPQPFGDAARSLEQGYLRDRAIAAGTLAGGVVLAGTGVVLLLLGSP